MKRSLALLCVLLALSALFPIRVTAQEDVAKDISGTGLVVESTGFPSVNSIFDDKRYDGWKTAENASITLTHEGGIGSLYLIFGKSYGPYTVTDPQTDTSFTVGQEGYAHAYVDLQELFGSALSTVTVRFADPAPLYELTVFGPGTAPDSVQRWQEPVEGNTDLVLFSTHSDDDQLFFAGLLPYYAVERDYQVQVVYLTDHFNIAPFRIHEVLDGLWAVGIRSYPVFGPFPDFGDTYTVEQAFYRFSRWGYSQEDMTGWAVEQLRRFKPLVAVAHDFNGEYGHTLHKVYAKLVADAVAVSANPEVYPESAETYGTWEVPKTYVHLYEENPIVMYWDIPMESFGGMTPYQVTKELGFPCHSSQQGGWGYFFRGHDTCAEIPHYNPSYYGLYRCTVGEDVQKDDMFENLISYGEQARIAEEEARKQAEEEARLKAEEEARQASEEAARQASEEAARRESEEAARLESEEAASQEQTPAETAPRPAVTVPAREQPPIWLLALFLGLLVTAIVLTVLILRPRGRKKKRKHRKHR
jgi:LmbE family N-acetylglucosaminyl deacetylase